MIPYLYSLMWHYVFLAVVWVVLLFVFSFCVLIVGAGKNARHYYWCGIIWLTISILLSRVAKKYDIIKKWWVRWLLILFSPAAIATIYLPVNFIMSMDLACKCSTLGTTGENISRRLINYHTGIDFPSMSYITGSFKDCYPDFSNTCTMKLKEKPDQDLIQRIKQSKEWQQDQSNLNHYYTWVRGGNECDDESEIITFDIKKGLIILKYIKM